VLLVLRVVVCSLDVDFDCVIEVDVLDVDVISLDVVVNGFKVVVVGLDVVVGLAVDGTCEVVVIVDVDDFVVVFVVVVAIVVSLVDVNNKDVDTVVKYVDVFCD
jgi:hypothetical protein